MRVEDIRGSHKKLTAGILTVFGILLLLYSIAVCSSFRVHAHEWYDPDCCSDRDCAPVIKSEPYQGGTLLFTKHGKVFLPKDWNLPDKKMGFKIRESQDTNMHACIVFDEYNSAVKKGEAMGYLLCLYVPGAM